MSEERLKVLEMLKDGKITTEEALTLLNELGNGNRQRFTHNHGYNPINDQDFGWVNDIRDSIWESIKNMQENVITPPCFPFGFGWSNHLTFAACSQNITQGIQSLRIIGKNDKIELTGYDEDTIKIEARYRTRANANPMIAFEEANGHYSLSYDNNVVQFMGLSVKVPRTHIDDLYVENKNASIIMKDMNFNKADIVTKNAPILLEGIEGKDLTAETKNAAIKLEDGSLSEIELLTSNSKITLKNAKADFAKLQTTNAAIHVDGVNIRKILTKTYNGGVKFLDMQGFLNAQYPQYTVEANTTNGDITVEVPLRMDTPCKIKASTSQGGIHADLDHLEFSVNEKNYMDAKTKGYDESDRKINFVLQTTNGHIRFRP